MGDSDNEQAKVQGPADNEGTRTQGSSNMAAVDSLEKFNREATMQQRQISAADIYHVTKRGTGKQLIFEDDEDKRELLELLKRECPKWDVEILAWAFMPNHVHLLANGQLPKLSKFVQTTFSTYALHFNRRHGRCGHVFQGRFSSQPVETDEYLLEVVRYIHLNPEKAGISSHDVYRWSSFPEYMEKPDLVNTAKIKQLLPTIEGFTMLHRAECPTVLQATRTIDGDELLAYAKRVLGRTAPHEVKALPMKERNRCLAALRRSGLTIKQVTMVTGIGKNIVQRAGKT